MKKLENIYSAVIILLFFVTVLGLTVYGKDQRTYTRPVITIGQKKPNLFVLSEPREAYSKWKSLKLKGRVVIHLGSHLPVKQDLRELMIPTNDTRVLSRRIDGSTLKLRDNNYLAAAMFDDIIRKIYAIVPDDKWDQTKSNLLKQGFYPFNGNYFDGALPTGTHVEIGPLALLSKVDEPVLVNLEANYFSSKNSAENLISAFKKDNIRTDCVTISISKRNPETSSLMKANAERFIKVLEK